MVYRIEYFKDGQLVRSVPWAQSLELTRKVAKVGLIQHDVDTYRIIDINGSGAEVASGRSDA